MSKGVSGPGVVMSFDDCQFIPDWFDALDVFDRFGAKLTFFIHAPDTIDEERWDMLAEIVRRGHCLGCHSLRHLKALDYIAENSLDDWINIDVVPALEILQGRGFEVSSFAYPCSQNDDATDNALKKYFRHARTGQPIAEGQRFTELDNIFKSVESVADSFLYPARGIDKQNDLSQITDAVDRAAENNEILFLLGHRIGIEEEGKDNRILTDINLLQKAFAHINEKGLSFYTYNDLP